MVALETVFCWFVFEHRLRDIVMVFLLGVVLTAVRFGYAASILATLLSVVALDFFFTQPYFSFVVADRQLLFTIVIMGFVALVISNQTERLRRTARAARERAAEAQRAQLEVEKERLRNTLLSSVSHDLRTPLAVVKGAATALLDGEHSLPPERRRGYLVTISQEASRLNRLVKNLVDMTSLEAGAVRVRKEWQPLEEIVGVSLNRLDDQLEQRKVDVRIASDASLVPLDATLMDQVFSNLVENAVKYTPVDARIQITARAVPSAVEITVADNGPGVPHGQEERVFDKFYRAGARGIGMGVGLTICRGILTAHGGRIWCENLPEGGASFRFVLPRGDMPLMKGLPEVRADS
jgi:two-component system sensor histidine kinase KdpD